MKHYKPRLHAIWLSSLWFLHGLIACLEAVPVRVATFNIENGIAPPGSEKYEAAKAVLVRIDADVIAFQELLRDSSTGTWLQNWHALAAELGYSTAFNPNGTSMSGSQRLGFYSRFPIEQVAEVRSPAGANEMSRPPMRVVIDVPGAAKPLILWNLHQKANEGTDPVLLERNQFRRAIEAIRTVQDINAYRLAHPDHDEFVVLGDFNADVFNEPQPISFSHPPGGLPSVYVLGPDISFPVFYRSFPDDAYANAGGGMRRLDAFQQNSGFRFTFPGWPSVLDYVIVSNALARNPNAPPVGEVYRSSRDAAFPESGLPKAGSALPANTSSLASDHLPVFVDLEMTDALEAEFAVSPAGVWSASGLPGGPFQPTQREFTLINPGTSATSWTVSADVPWLQTSESNGTLPAGASIHMRVTIDPGQTPQSPGTYFGSIEWTHATSGDRITRLVSLQVMQPGSLIVSAGEGIELEGPPGGPFNPSNATFTLTNVGQTALPWSAITAAPWINLSPTTGVLDPGASTTVTATPNTSSNALSIGAYSAALAFIDGNTGQSSTERLLTLRVRVRDYFSQQFSGGINLTGQSLIFAPDGSENHYTVRRETISSLPTPTSGDIGLTLRDDSFAAIDWSSGELLPFFGINYSRIHVGSNGYLTFGAGDTEWRINMPNHFRLPRISALYTDLNPQAGGTVSWRPWPDRIAVTYLNVPIFGSGGANSFQIELFFDGRIRISYLRIDATAGIIGISAGQTQPPDFLASDFENELLAEDVPLATPIVTQISANSAILGTYALPANLDAYLSHGFVISPSSSQPQPELGDALSIAVELGGPPAAARFEAPLDGLLTHTNYVVRAFLIDNHQIHYSMPVEFTTAAAPPELPYYATGFENVVKGSYAAAERSIDGLTWNLDDAMIGGDIGDMRNGTKSVRLRNGHIEMVDDLDRGIGGLRFLFSRSNFSNDRTGNPGALVVEYSNVQSPQTWIAVGSPINLNDADELTLFSTRIDAADAVRVRIRKSGGDSGKRCNIDDFSVTPFEPGEPSGPVVIDTDLITSGQVGAPLEYTIPTSGQPEFFEIDALPSGLVLDTTTGILSGMPTSAGVYELTVVAGNSLGVDSATLQLTIARGTPSILTPPESSTIFQGQSLEASVLSSGQADVPGSFFFANPIDVPGPGSSPQEVIFQPLDDENYEIVSFHVDVFVSTEAPIAEVIISGLETIYTGAPQSVVVTTEPPGLELEITYNGAAEVPVNAGDYEVRAIVINAIYSGENTANFTIDRAAPEILSPPIASTLTEGQALGSATLTGGTASVPGGFAFALPETLTISGTGIFDVIFTPEGGNFTTVTLAIPVLTIPALPDGAVVAIWNLTGQPGNQSDTPGAATTAVTALPMRRSDGLQAVATNNSINSSGWSSQEPQYYSFGITVNPGSEVHLQELRIGTRSSNGGPGHLALRWSIDDFESNLSTWSQPAGEFLNFQVDLTNHAPVTGTIEFRLISIDNMSASGGTITQSGTLRITNFHQNGNDSGWMGLTGLVMPSARIISPASAQGTVGEAFHYQIVTTGQPAAYFAGNLPDGLQFDPQTGVINGSPIAPGTTTITIGAMDPEAGEISTVLLLTILPQATPDPLEAWLQGEPLTPELLRAYAIGGSPAKNQPGMIPQLLRNETELQLTVVVRVDDPSLIITGESAGRLDANWSSADVEMRGRHHPDGPDQSSIPPGFERRIYAVPTDDHPARFLRLRISRD